jgi:hypothetical protein
MLYPVPPGLTTNGFSQGWNDRLSETDIRGASAVYPPEEDLRLGGRFRVAPGYISKTGLMVSSVRPGAPLQRLRRLGGTDDAALEAGDIIYQIAGKKMDDLVALRDVSEKLNGEFRIKIWNVQSKMTEDYVGRVQRLGD